MRIDVIFQMTNRIDEKYYYKLSYITYNYDFKIIEYNQYETV